MVLRVMKPVAVVLLLTLVAYHPSAYAASIPSKTMENQGSEARTADLAVARALFSTDAIEQALVAEGLTPDQVDARVAVLSTEDILTLGQNRGQVRSAGLNLSKRTWILLGIGAAAVIVLLVSEGGDSDAEGEED